MPPQGAPLESGESHKGQEQRLQEHSLNRQASLAISLISSVCLRFKREAKAKPPSHHPLNQEEQATQQKGSPASYSLTLMIGPWCCNNYQFGEVI
ncbi:hypothetical protein SEVIR_2G233051v4 [Setaria viridis]